MGRINLQLILQSPRQVYIILMYTACLRSNMAKKPKQLPYPERCICTRVVNEKPRRPRIYVQPSLYDGVITEAGCRTCGAWYPLTMEASE